MQQYQKQKINLGQKDKYSEVSFFSLTVSLTLAVLQPCPGLHRTALKPAALARILEEHTGREQALSIV